MLKEKESDATESKKSFKKVASDNIYFFKLGYKAHAARFISEIAVNIFDSVYYTLYSLYFFAFILYAIENNYKFQTVLFIFIGVNAFDYLWNIFWNWYSNSFIACSDLKINEYINLILLKKASDVELACYENPAFFDKYTRSAEEANTRIYQVFNNIKGFISSIFKFATLLSSFFLMDAVAFILIFIPLGVQFYLNKRQNKTKYEYDMANLTPNRMKAYANRAVYLPNFAKEIKMTNIFNVFSKRFMESSLKVTENTKKYGGRIALFRAWNQGISGICVSFPIFAYAILRVLVFKNLEIWQFMIIVNAIFNLSDVFSSFIGFVTELYKNSLYITNFKEFMEYKPKIPESQEGISPLSENNSLNINNVSFVYDGQTASVLKNISLQINPKEKIALVGHNGAGKSTLIKLIMRLYDVSEGNITLNGEDIKNYNVREYRNLYGTVFQDYQIIAGTVSENIMMRNVTEEDGKTIEYTMKMSGIYDRVQTLENKANSLLTKEFDDKGVIFSGGEYQKIAIARVFAKDCRFVILDEPSSALDPIAEYKMYENMMNLCRDKSVIFISHRLSSATIADRIYMLENGEIIESGSHSELMKQNGKYADMFRKQAEKYIEGSGVDI